MEHGLEPVLALLREMWRRRWSGLAAAWIVGVLAAIVVLRIPERHEVVARVYVDTQTMLKPLLQGLTVQPDIDQMVGMLARTLISRPSIERLVDNPKVGVQAPTPQAREALIEDLLRDIKMYSGGGHNLYEISYKDTNPERARRIVEELVSMFVSSGEDNKRRDTEEARTFIDEQISIYEKKLEEAENRLKNFKLHNLNVTGGAGVGGTSGQDYFARMAQIQQDLGVVRVDLQAAEQSRDALRRELAGVDSPVTTSADGQATSELPIDARIETQHKQLDELLRRYTDEHPDVIAAKRVIDQLEQERRREIDARRKLPAAVRSENRDNPVFQQIKIKLAEAEAQVASLRGRAGELSARLGELRGAASQVPQVEAELAQLNRDYDVIKKNYEQLAQRRESATISGDVDATARMAEFHVVEPARVNPKPVFPGRIVLVVIGLLAALASGVATCYGLARLMPTVQNPRDLRAVSSRPVLGSVSMLIDNAMLLEERRRAKMFAAAVGGLIVVYGVWAVAVLQRAG